MDKPRMSVVVLNWNGKKYLEGCINSLKQQTFKDLEIIVVDNGSTDGSVSYMKSNYSEIKLIELLDNKGFAAGSNAGIKKARGEYIATLNNDTVVDPIWAEELCKAMERNQSVGICGSKILLVDPEGQIDTVGSFFKVNGRSGNIGQGEIDTGRYDKECEVFGASAGAALYRASMLREIGLFDEDFFNSYEDNDLCFRANLRGYKCLYVPSALVHHLGTATIRSCSYFHIYHLSKNDLNPFIKCFPLRLMFKYLFNILFYSSEEAIGWIKWGQIKAIIDGRIRAFKDLKRMLKKRMEIQQTKKVSASYIDSLLTR